MTHPIPTEADRANAAADRARNEANHWIVYATKIAASAEMLNWAAALAGTDAQTWMLERIKAARVEAQAQYPIDLAPSEVDGQVAA
jgi:hypothetical protein